MERERGGRHGDSDALAAARDGDRWDDALINFDQSSWFPSPNYVVMKLYRDHFAPELLEIAGNAGDLNATATRTSDGERIYVKLVNPAGAGSLGGGGLARRFSAARGRHAGGGSGQPFGAQHDGATGRGPGGARAKSSGRGMTVRVRLPGWSVGVITLSR